MVAIFDRILLEAHECLGVMGKCASANGLLLRTLLRLLISLKSTHHSLVSKHVQQCIYCLYGHPSKKVHHTIIPLSKTL